MRSRRLVPWPLTIRWFATRGWAWGGALAFVGAALFLRPASNSTPEWVAASMFGAAGMTLAWLGLRPESVPVRCVTVSVVVMASIGRGISILVASSNDVGTQMAGTGIWLLIALWAWLLAAFTFRAASRRR